MALDSWLPIGHALPDGARSKLPLFEGPGWQIVQTEGGGRALLAAHTLVQRWITAGILDAGTLAPVNFGAEGLWSVSSGPNQVLSPVSAGRAPASKSEALAFAQAFKATRERDHDSPLQDALYLEKFSRLLPTYSISSRTDDAIVLGYWLTGGASIPATSFRRLSQTLSWLDPRHLKEIVEAAGFPVTESLPSRSSGSPAAHSALSESPMSVLPASSDPVHRAVFELPGRPDLATFFNEHVVDIVQHPERYKPLGIAFPSAIVLHGPPGCGKTFAVQRLIDFLGWPSFEIDAASVASPYIHETSKKVAQVFDQAIDQAPSVLVIDEMEAFLADRSMGTGHHRVEEVAEFLRRIPEAIERRVLIIAMTNRIDMIDPAILRRGRFDHVIQVKNASETEVLALLTHLLSTLPMEPDVEAGPLANALAGRPLSDVSFVVREAARLAARSGKARLDQASLTAALRSSPARQPENGHAGRIGFI